MRMRVGIGRDKDVVDYVLGSFKEEEKELLEKVIDCAADAAIELLKAPAPAVMNRVNALDLSECMEEKKESK